MSEINQLKHEDTEAMENMVDKWVKTGKWENPEDEPLEDFESFLENCIDMKGGE